jgi:HAD superfamily hydrolase (TIGR01549 family)
VSAVSFDFGQTLAELDLAMLCRRALERGETLSLERAKAASADAWAAYNAAKRVGIEHREAWCTFMQALLLSAGVSEPTRAQKLADWLWYEQPSHNLWRKPIAGMFELVGELRDRGVAVGIISNSEGHLAELAAELGVADHFRAIADSGALGYEKPDPRIFHWAAERLGIGVRELVHVGDAWEADVTGALIVGARAIWFAPDDSRELPDGVRAAADAGEVRAALAAFGVL